MWEGTNTARLVRDGATSGSLDEVKLGIGIDSTEQINCCSRCMKGEEVTVQPRID